MLIIETINKYKRIYNFMKLILQFLFLLFASNLFAKHSAFSRSEYISSWKNIAINQMIQYKIPASITLAQGILESGNGNSKLAMEANNHFGIKCHGWKGDKVYMDDDAKGECFRSYINAEDSYKDHSLFLTSNSRYKSLFNYNLKDYKSWAKGLKKAGYATNNSYAELLIKIIEKEKLYHFDKNILAIDDISATGLITKGNSKRVKTYSNRVRYIIASSNDTYYKIAVNNGLTLRQLHRYNNMPANKSTIEKGDVICITPKKIFSKKDVFIINKKMTLIDVSQKTGLKLKRLIRLNEISNPEMQLNIGSKIFLK